MTPRTLVGALLVGGLAIVLVGAVRWRLAYERPMVDSLPLIHADRRRGGSEAHDQAAGPERIDRGMTVVRWAAERRVAEGAAPDGFVATRFAGPFNTPFMAHLYTAIVGLVLLTR